MTKNPTDPLPPIDDQAWQRVLCIAAHPDDMEYGTSAAVQTWTERGIEVAYLLLTGGEAGMSEPPEVVGPLRAAEQRRACDTVGVERLTILEHPDGMLEYGLDLRRSVARAIRTFRPDAVVTNNFSFDAPWGLNQADHRATGLAVVDGTRDADNRWVFTELVDDEGLDPWHTSALLIATSAGATHALSLGPDAVQAAIDSLNCHEAYLRHITGHPVPDEMIPAVLSAQGEMAGVDHAVVFKVYDL